MLANMETEDDEKSGLQCVRVWKPFSRPQPRSGEDDERLAKAGTPDGEAGTPEIFVF